jgi:hypothetical protein
MCLEYFNKTQLGILDEALDIAEDMTSNYFKLSVPEWKRHPFDVKTLTSLVGDDIRENAFALLKKFMSAENGGSAHYYRGREFYMICLQDHQILGALRRDRELRLLPLLTYILTHELVHVIRFFKFEVRFDTEEDERRTKEEEVVHQKTYEILNRLALPNLTYILNSYNPDPVNLDICMI